MPKHIANWNPARDVWETDGTTNLFCGHSDVYSGTFPTSGMTRNGVAYELPTWGHRTEGSGSSSSPNDEDDDALLRTPCAQEAGGGPLHPDDAKANGQTLRLTGQILAHFGHLKSRADRLLPTPRTSDTNGAGRHGTGGADLRTIVDEELNNTDEWGQFAGAIRRWEDALGRPAPPATVPTGRGGKHQLNPVFAEWMMGLPEGWVTDVGITRNEQLKALGNGVVPQQCTAALTDMLATTRAQAA